jgi:sec-independent protein translocase protein TatB
MFDVGFWELLLIFGVGLMILGPERMPRVAAQVGRWVGRARRTATQLRRQLQRELELDEYMNTRPPPTKPPPSPKKPEASDESTKSSTPPPEDVHAEASTPNISSGGKDGGDEALERENQILSPDQVSESQAAAVEEEPSKSS